MSRASSLLDDLEEIRRLAALPPAKGRGPAMGALAMNVLCDRTLHAGEVAPALVPAVIATIRAVQAAGGGGRTRTEGHLVEVLESLFLALCRRDQRATRHRVARELWAFGLESLACRRPRDSTIWQRHERLYALLATVAPHRPAAHVRELAQQALRSEQDADVAGGLRLIELCVIPRDRELRPEAVRELAAVVKRTRNRDNLVGALQLLVRASECDEFGALATLEDWDTREARRARRESAARQRP